MQTLSSAQTTWPKGRATCHMLEGSRRHIQRQNNSSSLSYSGNTWKRKYERGTWLLPLVWSKLCSFGTPSTTLLLSLLVSKLSFPFLLIQALGSGVCIAKWLGWVRFSLPLRFHCICIAKPETPQNTWSHVHSVTPLWFFFPPLELRLLLATVVWHHSLTIAPQATLAH